MNTTLKIGDRVQLGDGPCMIVLDFGRESGLVWCRWIGDTGQIAEGAFPVASLRPFRNHRHAAPQVQSFAEAMADY